MGYNLNFESLENTMNTMGTLLGVHPIVRLIPVVSSLTLAGEPILVCVGIIPWCSLIGCMKNYPYEAEAAKEKDELRQQLKAARKERRASDKKAAQTAKKKKAWAATTAARKRAARKEAKEAQCFFFDAF